jgi:hypothetical protein
VVSHSFPFRASRRLKFSHNSILPCTAFPSTLVSMLELSPPLPILLLPRVGGLSALSTRAVNNYGRSFAFLDSGTWPLNEGRKAETDERAKGPQHLGMRYLPVQ